MKAKVKVSTDNLQNSIEIITPTTAKLYTSSLSLLQGEKGDTGNTGAVGPQGPQGLKGDTGSKGDTGNTGLTGATGAVGATGPNGQQGIQGIKGDTGNIGETGPQGLQGVQGEQGELGLQGPQGEIGLTGPQGAKGDTGLTGFSWDVTRIGANGYVAGDIVNYLGNYYICIANNDALVPTTALGVYWNTYSFLGAQGPQGIEGAAGSQGQAGASVTLKGSVANTAALPASGNTIGDSYINDADGNLYVWTGTTWHDAGQIVGPEGPQGQQGIQGVKGDTGEQGPQGNVGPQGPQGLQGNQGTTPKMTYTTTSNIALNTMTVGATVTFPRDPDFQPQVYTNLKINSINNNNTYVSGTWGALITGWTATTIDCFIGVAGWDSNYATADSFTIAVVGQRGLTGNTGQTGPAGSAGATGAKGDTGDTGPQGVAGEVGPQGPQGLTGNTGATGAEGPQGPQGLTGPAGANGTAATITVGTTTTGATAAVTNSGTSSAAILDFVLPTSSGGGSSTNPIYSQISNGLEFFDDFFNLVTSNRPIPILVSTSGASNNQFANTTGANRIGQLYQQCTNPGKVVWADVLGVAQSNYIKTFECRTKVNQLIGAVSNESFVVNIGGRYSHYNTAYNANGPMACFVYDPLLTNAYSGTGATASPNWQIATGWNSNLTGTDVIFHNTGIPVDNNYHTFKTVLTPAGPNGVNIIADYYYDGTLIHTRTITNYGGYAQLGHGVSIYKNSGINFNINVETDYIYINFKPSFAR